MNKIIVTGRLTSKPFSGETGNRILYSRFTIACQRRSYGNNQEPIVDFLPCVAWRNNAEFVNKYLDKGSLVLVEGSLQASRLMRDGVSSTVFSINVDTVEGLESRKTAELRKQSQDTQETSGIDIDEMSKSFYTKKENSNNSNISENINDSDEDEHWDGFDVSDIE